MTAASAAPELRGPVAALDCFHCGLPVPAGRPWRSEVLGEVRDFCCGGCRAAAETIRDGGLEAYYELRSSPSAGPAPDASRGPQRIFDRADVQAEFVRAAGPHREARLLLEGVSCDACLWLNERRLRAVPGVLEASVGYADHCARVRWDPARVELSAILSAVEEIGYRARPVDPSHRLDIEAEASRRNAPRLLFAGVVGMMVMNLALAAYFAGGSDASGRLPLWEAFARWAELLGALALLAYPGQEFFAGAWRDLRHRRVGMDVPIAAGLAAAWLGGAWATVRGSGAVYFDAIAMLVFFVLAARALQTRARLHAAAAVDRFAVVEPATARRVEAAGNEEEVAALDLREGDVVRIGPGEAAPADGIVIEGQSSFDEGVLTGEPWPRRRAPGEEVVAGSRNGERDVLVRVARPADASTLGEIRRLLERGLASRPAIAELTDRLAGRLTGAVLLCAAATAAFWAVRDPSRILPATVAVLIVTCPCALALAAPVVLTLAAGRLTRIGVLPLRMAALEALGGAGVAAFDKTGTLTTGQPRLESVDTDGIGREEAIAIAAALEAGSRHPIAAAILAASGRRETAEDLAADREGRGVEGTIRGVPWRIGAAGYVLDGEAPTAIRRAVEAARGRQRLTALLSDRNGRTALFTFTERFRPGAAEIAESLRADGVQRVALLSGDARATVLAIAAALGFDEAQGEMIPASKLAWIGARRAAGARVLFVGDGWNDAPTLAAADVSVSLAQAPAVSRLASDFVILGGDLSALSAARSIGRKAMRLLRQNVAWALGYNILIVPLAAAGRIPPWTAALAMSVSSLAVVANALRLAKPGAGRESVHAVEAQPQLVGQAGDAG